MDFSSDGDGFWFEDELTCADGTGSFVLRVSGLGPPPADGLWIGPWAIVRGTAEYEDLNGDGRFSADFSTDPAVATYAGDLLSD